MWELIKNDTFPSFLMIFEKIPSRLCRYHILRWFSPNLGISTLTTPHFCFVLCQFKLGQVDSTILLARKNEGLH